MRVLTVCHPTFHSCMNCPVGLVCNRFGKGWHHAKNSGGCDRPRHYIKGCWL